jgi:hypothetical protein
VRALTCELVESPRVFREFIYGTIPPVKFPRPDHSLFGFCFLVLNRDWLLHCQAPLDLLLAVRPFIMIVPLGCARWQVLDGKVFEDLEGHW